MQRRAHETHRTASQAAWDALSGSGILGIHAFPQVLGSLEMPHSFAASAAAIVSPGGPLRPSWKTRYADPGWISGAAHGWTRAPMP
eukprot:1109831-Alexandrium_andersonii.AAC.1